ncbi:MAG: 4-alpha-glucanotransferase [Acidobacteriota bacterium]
MTGGGTSGRRLAGLLVPLFSCRSTRGWGIGEFADLPILAAWMREAGLRLLQLLPLNEMAAGQRSPYSATSAMALDPIYISVDAVPDFQALGGEGALDARDRQTLAHLRSVCGVDYVGVREIKTAVLRASFRRFVDKEWLARSDRARDFGRFADQQRWWLDDYAVFRALHHTTGGGAWQDWPAGIRDRDPEALARVRRELEDEVLFRQYVQWIAHGQWLDARAAAHGVRLYGDFPFGVAADSADAWANQELFSFDSTIGAPPDAFSDEGQNWRLPMYRWDLMAAGQFEWFARRARRVADLFDGFRVDHLVGLFRTWAFPVDDRPPHFVPADQVAQDRQGRAVLSTLLATGADVVAEDLGTIPDFVRAALRALDVPGYRVLRWEREWDTKGQPFRDPRAYPACSLATSGTHDTETLAAWWNASDAIERTAALAATGVATLGADAAFLPDVLDCLLETLFASGSDLLVLPIQDVFGWTDRVNVPGLVDDINWTWTLPWAVDQFAAQPEARSRSAVLKTLSIRHNRLL